MHNKKNMLSTVKWIIEVSNRFAHIDRAGRSAITTILATLGISFGVMTLITVLSVMNGFQQTSVKPIMEISSYHLRATDVPDELFIDFLEFCDENKKIASALPFYESQSLMVGKKGNQASSIIRGVSKDIMARDNGFKQEVSVVHGKFDLNEDDSIVLGSTIAKALSVHVGDYVNLLALSGGKDVALISQNRKFKVTGIFSSTFYDINAGYAFINIEAAEKNFGSDAVKIYGIKLTDYDDDIIVMGQMKNLFPEINVLSWREYNRSFFGTLRVEKNILMLLVCIIFVVVGINIYNGMRRLVFERSQDISILSALGGTRSEIRLIFIMRGFTSGFAGAFSGALAGILISVNIKSIFIFFADLMFYVQYFFLMLFVPYKANYISQNMIYELYAEIPAQIVLKEVLMIVLFGIIAPLVASWRASDNVLKMSVAEVLHDE